MCVLLGLLFGFVEIIEFCVMVNIVGDKIGIYKLTYLNELAKLQGVYVHLYGKKESRPNRKLGHITILHNDRNELIQLAEKVRTLAEIEIIGK